MVSSSWLSYYRGVCSELETTSLYDAVSKRVDVVMDIAEHLSDKQYDIISRALAEIQMLVGGEGKNADI